MVTLKGPGDNGHPKRSQEPKGPLRGTPIDPGTPIRSLEAQEVLGIPKGPGNPKTCGGLPKSPGRT